MEAMPRLPMMHFHLKQVSKPSSLSGFIKRSIFTGYTDDPNHFTSEIYEFESLRAAATRPSRDLQGLSTLKRYYCQLQALMRRFPELNEHHVEDLVFYWQDLYSGCSMGVQDPSYELAAVMYNIGALHTLLGAADTRQTPDGMKMSCTHFQCAAGAFQYVQEKLTQPIGTDINRGMMQFHIEIALAQAQECILEKSMVDNRKGIITAKVAAQVADYHRAARRCLENALKTGEYLPENVTDRKMKQWVEHVELKAPLYDAVSLLYRGMQAEEQQRMGERITFYQAAAEKLTEAAAVGKRISGQEGKTVAECLSFINDVIGGKLNNAKKENEFIYHEKVPTIESLPDIKGASLVKGIPFDLADKDVAGPDIFQKLIPMEAHEHASLYSSKKDELLRTVLAQVEQKDQELMVLLSSMQLQQLEMVKPYISESSSNIQLPQELVDCVAAMHARPTVVPQLHEAMSQLSGLSVDLQDSLDELETMLKDEEEREKEHAAAMGGRRPPSMITTELRREFTKYREAHQHAAESDTALHRAISAHLPNLSLLAGPLEALASQLPSAQSVVQQPEASAAVEALQRMVDKVEQMRRQRVMLCGHLKDAVRSDDITKRVVTSAGDDVPAFMDKELDKHRKQAAVIEQNLAAQDNILRALTEANAGYAPTRQQAADVLAAREARITELLTSHRALDELLGKGKQGVAFYNKLQENVTKLLTRARGVCKVHAEERTSSLAPSAAAVSAASSAGAPRLRDYLAAGYRAGEQPPRVRPSPLGSEQTDPACSGAAPGRYAAQMAQYMQSGGPAKVEATGATEQGGYAAQMAQFMQSRGPVKPERSSAQEQGGYAAQMAQYMQGGRPGDAAGGYAAQMAQYMSGGYRAASPAAGGQPDAARESTYGGAVPAAAAYLSQQQQPPTAGYPTPPTGAAYPAQTGYPSQPAAPVPPAQSGYPAQPGGYSAQSAAAGYPQTYAGGFPPEQQAKTPLPAGQPPAGPAPLQSGYPAASSAMASGAVPSLPMGPCMTTQAPAAPQPPAAAAVRPQVPAEVPAGPYNPPGAGIAADTPPVGLPTASSTNQYGYRTSDPYLAFYGGGGYTSWTPYQTFSRPPGSPGVAGSLPYSSHQAIASASPSTQATHSHSVSSVAAGSATAPGAAPSFYTPPRLVGSGHAQTNSRPSGIAPYALATGYPSSMASPTTSLAQLPSAQTPAAPVGAVVNGGTSAYPGVSAAYPSASAAAVQQPTAQQYPAAAASQPRAGVYGQSYSAPGSSQQPVAAAYATQSGTAPQQSTATSAAYNSATGPHQPYGAGTPQSGQYPAPQPAYTGAAGVQQGQYSTQGYQQTQYYPGYGYQYPGAGQQQAPASQPAPGQQAYSTQQQQQQTYQQLKPLPPQAHVQPSQQAPYPAQQAQMQPSPRHQPPQQGYQYPARQPASPQHRPSPPPQQPQQYAPVAGQTASLPQVSAAGAAGGSAPAARPAASAPGGLSGAASGGPGQQTPPLNPAQYLPPTVVPPGGGPGAQYSLPAVAPAQHGPAAASPAPGAGAYAQQGPVLPKLPQQQGGAAAPAAAQPQQTQPPQRLPPIQQPPPAQPLQTPLQPQPAAQNKPCDGVSQSARLLAGLDLSGGGPAPPALSAPDGLASPASRGAGAAPPTAASAPASSVQLSGGSTLQQTAAAPAGGGDLLSSTSVAGGVGASSATVAPLQPRVVTSETERQSREQAERERRKLAAQEDPYADPEKLAAFVQEVERMDKYVAGMTKKSLNGPTPLDSKWKELMDQQETDARRLQISVARCYPMKNRLQEVLPFDASLVPVPLVRDDYINASRLPELSGGAPALIVTQAPLAVTQTDFWCMVWHHQVELVVCLLPDSELMEGQLYWPPERGVAATFGPVQLTLQTQSAANGRVERILSLLHSESKMSRVVIHLQFAGWPRAALPSSPAPLVQFATEVLQYHQQQRSLLRSIVVHCWAGAGRSAVFCVLAAALAELRAGGGLVEPSAVAALLHQARRHCLQDKQHLLFAYQAVLYAAQDFLMKRGILTSRATFDDRPGSQSRGHSRHPSEDFLATNRSVCELQARLGALAPSAAGAAAMAAPPSPAGGSSSSLPTSALSAAAAPAGSGSGPGAGAGAAGSAASRRSSAPHLSGPLAACLNPATFEIGQPAAAAVEEETAEEPAGAEAAGHDPLSELDPLWSLKKK